MINFDFKEFIETGETGLPYGLDVRVLLGKLGDEKYQYAVFNKEAGQSGIIYKNVELLFYDDMLYIIEFEATRLKTINLGDNIITEETTLDDFKAYLRELDISYSEKVEWGQVVLTTDKKIALYFSKETEKFITAMNVWG